MAFTFEGNIPSLLQGVSQQIPRERLPGQVSLQINMLSDPVRGMRRRPPAKYEKMLNFIDGEQTPWDSIYVEFLNTSSDVGSHLIISTQSGKYEILSEDLSTTLSSGQNDYFKSTTPRAIQTASLYGETYILNTEQQPRGVIDNTGKIDPSITGFFYVKSGAFSKYYNIIIDWTDEFDNRHSESSSYSTPDGNSPGDAAKATPEYIAQELRTNLPSSIPVNSSRNGSYISFILQSGMSDVYVKTYAGYAYAIASGPSRVPLETDLPAVLSDNLMCAVGDSLKSLVWYRFNVGMGVWDEIGSYNSVTVIENMPLKVTLNNTIEIQNFEGRLAGDEDTNKTPTFLSTSRISGIASYQGRLVLLSGSSVCMSAAGHPTRFYRSTVTELLDSDRIDIGAGSIQNSVFRRAVQFNKDLVLIGDNVQAVIPSITGAITSKNASVLLTSTQLCDSFVTPVETGQTLLYAMYRSVNFGGVLELIPSQYTASQYISQDSTIHIPTYLPQKIKLMRSSTNTNMVVGSVYGDNTMLFIHEYQFNVDGKVQSAWHSWKFKFKIGFIYFGRNTLYIIGETVSDNKTLASLFSIDIRGTNLDPQGNKYPFMDGYHKDPIQLLNGKVTVPTQLVYFALNNPEYLVLTRSNGPMAGEEIGISNISDMGTTLQTVDGVTDGDVYLGLRYDSMISPTSPMMRDRNGDVIGTSNTKLVRYEITLQESGKFDVLVHDKITGVNTEGMYTALLMNSCELSPGKSTLFSEGKVVIPCRTYSNTTDFIMKTSGIQEMNIIDVEYVIRHNQARRRI
jgi:hypothetical protein